MRQWWANPPDVDWDAYQTNDGQNYYSRDEALCVAQNLRSRFSLKDQSAKDSDR